MLRLFEVEGFKNFRDRITLDFSNVRDYRFNKECITDNFLGKMIIYGKNSVGKTNFGLALFDIVAHLTTKNVSPHLYDYYLNADNSSGYAAFHYVFVFENRIVDYVYHKNDKQELLYEQLHIDDELLFSFDYVKKTGDLSGIAKISPTLNCDFDDIGCVLTYIVNNTILEENHPLRKMMYYVNHMLWFRVLDENRCIGYTASSKNYFDFIFENDLVQEFETFLHKAGVHEDLIALTDPDGKKRLYFNAKVPLPFFSVASSGTKALYTFFYWYKTAEDVSFMFLDEFDAYYHYELSETIVKIAEQMKHTQVIFTSHNTNLLSNRIMRPDCYFILTPNKLTSIVDATDRELREGHNLEKLYMSGEFDG